MTASIDQAIEEPRLPTGIPQLDALLYGGLLTGGLYLIMGTPGSGKTILANQVAYSYAKSGGRVAYITVLGETHSRLLAHLRHFQFFDSTLLGNNITYISGYRNYRTEGLTGLGNLISSTIIQERLELIVIDGLPIDVQTPGTPDGMETNDFVHSLQAICETANCTVMMTTPTTVRTWDSHIFLFVDGVIDLQRFVHNAVELRTLEIRKFRGSAYRAASQPFTITRLGITPLL